MYRPPYQREDDPARLWATVEQYSFASLICANDDGRPLSTLVPFVRREDRLFCHMAAANPQGPLVADGRPVLCQFLGPHAYHAAQDRRNVAAGLREGGADARAVAELMDAELDATA